MPCKPPHEAPQKIAQVCKVKEFVLLQLVYALISAVPGVRLPFVSYDWGEDNQLPDHINQLSSKHPGHLLGVSSTLLKEGSEKLHCHTLKKNNVQHLLLLDAVLHSVVFPCSFTTQNNVLGPIMGLPLVRSSFPEDVMAVRVRCNTCTHKSCRFLPCHESEGAV